VELGQEAVAALAQGEGGEAAEGVNLCHIYGQDTRDQQFGK
jgi:hypothetical protein